MQNKNDFNQATWAKKIGITRQLFRFWIASAKKGNLRIEPLLLLMQAGYEIEPFAACSELRKAQQILDIIEGADAWNNK